jgi:hypothetical protein
MRRALAWLVCVALLLAGMPERPAAADAMASAAAACSCCAVDDGGGECGCGCASPQTPRPPQRAPDRDARVALSLPARQPSCLLAVPPPAEPGPRAACANELRAARAHPLQAELRVFLL